MKIKEIMHSPTRLPSDTSIVAAAKIMDNKGIGSILVEEQGNIVGMMTERDILRKVVAVGKRCEETTVKEIMNYPLITLDHNASVEEASEIMSKHHIRRLVVTENNEVVGIVTVRNLAGMLRYSLGRSIKDMGISHYKPDYSRQ